MAGENKHVITFDYNDEMYEIFSDLQKRRGKNNHAEVVEDAILWLRLATEPGVSITGPKEVFQKYGVDTTE